MNTTPAEITGQILELCRRLEPTQQPVWVRVEPWHRGDVDFCFYNVKDKVASDGGNIQYGWTIWEQPRVLIEAEFHAVWVSPTGEYIDITEKADREQEILFLPDSHRVWTGTPVENVRVALMDNEYTRQLIKYSEAMFQLRKKYWRYNTAEIPVHEYLRVQKEYGLSNLKIGRNKPCSCGSGIKYKKCCGLGSA